MASSYSVGSLSNTRRSLHCGFHPFSLIFLEILIGSELLLLNANELAWMNCKIPSSGLTHSSWNAIIGFFSKVALLILVAKITLPFKVFYLNFFLLLTLPL